MTKTMQNPYCKRCWNSYYVTENKGICDKCNIIVYLSTYEKICHNNNLICGITYGDECSLNEHEQTLYDQRYVFYKQ